MWFSKLVALSLLVLASWPAHILAASWAEADAAFQQGKFVKALKVWQHLGEKGDAKALYNVASMYEEGKGVARNYAKAATFYRKAAEKNFAPAHHKLGSLYSIKRGVPHDEVKAAKWFRHTAQ